MDAAEKAVTPSRGRAADLYQQHAAEAVQFAYLLTGDKHLAEDLAQDAFVRLFGRFQDLRKPESFAFYLKRLRPRPRRSRALAKNSKELPDVAHQEVGNQSNPEPTWDEERELWRS